MKTLILSLALLASSCGDDTFRKVEQLDRFRILAIEASAPEVAPGGSSNLRLFVSDPKGPPAGREITGTLTTCIDPGIALGASVKCDHDPSRVTSSYTIDTRGADFTTNLGTGLSSSVSITVPGGIFTSRSSREQFNGVGYIAIFSFTVDGSEVTAFKRLIATTRTGANLNSNPSGASLLLNGAAFAGNPQKGDRLSLSSAAAQSYDYINVDGSTEVKSEDLQVAWYISETELDAPKTKVGERVEILTEPPAQTYLIIGILRDERGGLEVLRQRI
ncbi:MAG: hypothetical protein LW878_13215 [Proteobacteria bacterium]|nr:hypothetical protein [Pseudomonadota bacterium]